MFSVLIERVMAVAYLLKLSKVARQQCMASGVSDTFWLSIGPVRAAGDFLAAD